MSEIRTESPPLPAGADSEINFRIRMLLVSDVLLYREGLALALGSDARLCVVANADREHAIALFALRPDAVLLDIESSGALEWARDAAARPGAPPIVAFAVSDSEQNVIECIEAGIAAYAPRGASIEDLVTVVRHVVRGEAVCSPRVTGSLFRRVAALAACIHAPAGAPLTRRESEILQLLGRRLSNKEIAGELNIGLATVKNHVHNILDKLHAESREQAVRFGKSAAHHDSARARL